MVRNAQQLQCLEIENWRFLALAPLLFLLLHSPPPAAHKKEAMDDLTSCVDHQSFTDSRGFDCTACAAYNCTDYDYFLNEGYTIDDVRSLQENCPSSCGYCSPPPVCKLYIMKYGFTHLHFASACVVSFIAACTYSFPPFLWVGVYLTWNYYGLVLCNHYLAGWRGNQSVCMCERGQSLLHYFPGRTCSKGCVVACALLHRYPQIWALLAFISS